jgi:hypothetical protein
MVMNLPAGAELARLFRSPRSYAPELVTKNLQSIVDSPELALLVDVDALERSALARIDRVMQLALSALARVRVSIFLAARYERERAAALQRHISETRFLVHAAPLALPLVRAEMPSGTPLIALSDDPPLFELLAERDRGLALGRPELARTNVISIADTAVRATLWWLHEERVRALAS